MTLSDGFEILNARTLARLPLLSRLAFDFAFTVAKWQMRSVTRKSLTKLDSHMLRDIGMKPSDAHFESTKRFWQD